MQFIKNGPDVPERLLQAHEDGNVVFFCGAGISYPAGLPGFSDLVKNLYENIGESPDALESLAIKAGQYDTCIGLLESRIAGRRKVVRRSIDTLLTPNLNLRDATTTHDALLTLARSHKDGHTRLITTNFDRLFEEVIIKRDLKVECFQAPLLPIPKNRWDGLVYLHGLLPQPFNEKELERLVLSSGDFGLAYLIERWAARFVSELFQNYTICFVGYSINDPVLRYMMDALAADRLLGESPPEMFAFGSYSQGKKEERATEWKAKNVTPILYREHKRHIYMHKTIRAWAATYKDGVNGKERIVIEYAIARPQASTRQDDFVGRVLWALADPSGLPAKRFAGDKFLDPAPSLEWLDAFDEARYKHEDLHRFGVAPLAKHDAKLAFSLIRRPTPYTHSSLMTLADNDFQDKRWDEIMSRLACWLTRHLNDPKLILWLSKQGAQLHYRLIWLIEQQLEEFSKLEREGNTFAIESILNNSPKAIPSPLMRTLWNLLLTGRIYTPQHRFDLFQWVTWFKSNGLTPTRRMELCKILAPSISLREPIQRNEEAAEPSSEHLRSLVDWELHLCADDVHVALHELDNNLEWYAVLPELLDDFTLLLRNALDLMAELGSANAHSDLSYIAQPSISEHSQNCKFYNWTALIDLTRDAWLSMLAKNPERAFSVVEYWQFIPYPLFRRLALFAAAQESIIPFGQSLKWLLADSGWWLWSNETKREAINLLVALTPHMNTLMLNELEESILNGPPRAMFRDDLGAEDWRKIRDQAIFLRLAKLSATGVVLGEAATIKLNALNIDYPNWQIAKDESDEFSFWMSSDESPQFLTPRRRRELANWLKINQNESYREPDDWPQRCRDNFSVCATALCMLAKEGIWPEDRWRQAIQAWSNASLAPRSWRYLAPLLNSAPDILFETIARAISFWLESVAKNMDRHESVFISFCLRLLALNYPDDNTQDEPVMLAINHPIGNATQALLNWWYRQSLEDSQGIPHELKAIFTGLCDTQVVKYRHARVLLASHIITFFRVDLVWTIEHLLPLFDWQKSQIEARNSWVGFLQSPRLYRPLLLLIKPLLLETVVHYELLGKNGKQYAVFITYAALDRDGIFSTEELQQVYRVLPHDDLIHVVKALARAMEGVKEDQREAYWNNRIMPFWRHIWPKSREIDASTISNDLVRLCIAAGSRFSEALTLVGAWLQPFPYLAYTITLLHKSQLCSQFPSDALTLLNAIVDDQPWPTPDLGNCLKEIKQANSTLTDDPRFMRLEVYWKRHDTK